MEGLVSDVVFGGLCNVVVENNSGQIFFRLEGGEGGEAMAGDERQWLSDLAALCFFFHKIGKSCRWFSKRTEVKSSNQRKKVSWVDSAMAS